MSETGFDETPDVTSRLLEEFARAGLLNIAGGCCGTTPEHIAEIAKELADVKPRVWANYRKPIRKRFSNCDLKKT